MTRAGGTCSDISTCEASMRLASKASGTTSVAPASLSSRERVSSGVRTRMAGLARSGNTFPLPGASSLTRAASTAPFARPLGRAGGNTNLATG